MAAKKKTRKRRKLSAAHLKALQAGLKRWKRGAGKSKRARPAKRKASKRKVRVTVAVSNPPKRRRHSSRGSATKTWWMFDTGNGCYVGSGSHAQAKARAQQFANRTGQQGHLVGPFHSREQAKAACG
jgi:hypothetical protein